MNMSANNIWVWLTDDLRRIGVVISALLSVWVILTNDTINVDGILYLDAAHQIKLGNWDEAGKLYRWLFYPLLIAIISKITFLGLEPAAFLINSVFFAGIIWLFLSLLQAMNASQRVMLTGLMIICIHPYMNESRADVSRDPGFWFFILWSIILLIRFKKHPRWINSLYWGISITLATLFRIEGIAYALFAPAILLFDCKGTPLARVWIYLKASMVPISLALIAFVGILAGLLPKGRLYDPVDILHEFITAISTTIPSLGDAMAIHVLTPLSSDYGTVGVYAVLLSIFILTVIKRTTVLLLAAGCYAILSRQIRLSIQHAPLLFWFIVINLVTLVAPLITHLYLSSRFVMPAALIMALFAAFGLASVFEITKNRPSFKWRSVRTITMIVLAIMLIDGLVSFGHSKRYIRDAGYWLEQQMTETDTLVTNHLLIRHHAGRRWTQSGRNLTLTFGDLLVKGTFNKELILKSDYIAIRSKHLKTETLTSLEQTIGYKPTKVFSDGHKDKVFIYYRSADKSPASR